eukprot:COSAG01_NODE_795_length_13541_cov_5.530725_8_plen_131_part_00
MISDGDVYLLHDYISDDFMGLVQYNSDAPLGSGRVNIRSRCAQMLNSSFAAPPPGQRPAAAASTPLDRLVAITRERAGKGGCVFDPDPSGVTHSIRFAEHLRGYANSSNAGRSFPYRLRDISSIRTGIME